MAVYYVKGNLLDADVDYICHQVNCQGKMNSGIAKSIREKWPIVYENYMKEYNDSKVLSLRSFNSLLGKIQFVPIDSGYKQHVINLFAQERYGYDNMRYTSYDAFWSCLGKMRIIPKGSKIGFPDHIGCCRGGADWEVIRTMIEEVLGKDYEVYIYRLEEK